MSSDKSQLEYVLEQIAPAGVIRAKSMFGEFGIYCNEKIVALFCDNQLFVKPTAAGKAFAPDVAEGPPYPGAKPYLLIEEQIEDQEWVSELIRLTARDLPPPKEPKAKRAMNKAKKRASNA